MITGHKITASSECLFYTNILVTCSTQSKEITALTAHRFTTRNAMHW